MLGTVTWLTWFIFKLSQFNELSAIISIPQKRKLKLRELSKFRQDSQWVTEPQLKSNYGCFQNMHTWILFRNLKDTYWIPTIQSQVRYLEAIYKDDFKTDYVHEDTV